MLEWPGRFLVRIHAVSASRAYLARPYLDIQSFGIEQRNFIVDSNRLPEELRFVAAFPWFRPLLAESYP